MVDSIFTLKFDGRQASYGRLDLYDASQSFYGLARVLAVLGHYYSTGAIIYQAPASSVKFTSSLQKRVVSSKQ